MTGRPAIPSGVPGSGSSEGWRTAGPVQRCAMAAADLGEVERQIWRLLAPYRARGLEDATIYGMPSLRLPGAKAHDYFAAVKPAAKHVSLFLVAVDAHPEVLDGASPALLKRRTGKAAFTFPSLDRGLADDLAALLERLFLAYAAD